MKCFKCGKLGHMKKNCYAKEENNMLLGLLDEDDDDFEQVFMTIDNEEVNREYDERMCDDSDVSSDEDENEKVYSVTYTMEEEEDKKDQFLIDTGATVHIVNDKKHLINERTDEVSVSSMDGMSKYYTRGDVELPNGIILHDVVYVKKSPRNVISLTLLNLDGYNSAQINEWCHVMKNEKVLMKVPLKGKLYQVSWNQMFIKYEEVFMINLDVEEDDDNWLDAHRNMGHASKNQLITQGYEGKDISIKEHCAVCARQRYQDYW